MCHSREGNSRSRAGVFSDLEANGPDVQSAGDLRDAVPGAYRRVPLAADDRENGRGQTRQNAARVSLRLPTFSVIPIPGS